jgi:hypothetical protein
MLGTRMSRPHPVRRRVIPDIEDGQPFRASRSCGQDVRLPSNRLSRSIARRSQSTTLWATLPNPENFKAVRYRIR